MKRPWMPLYVSDYLNDTAHLTAAESGAYLHLIMFYWVNGRLPSDEKAIARITRLGSMSWSRSRDRLKQFFSGDDWSHPRIDAEIAKAIEISNTNSANAKRRHYGRATNGHASADTPTPTYTKKIVGVNGEGKREGFKSPPNSPEFVAWKQWAFEKKTSLWRELVKREQEGRAFDFQNQWPPNHKIAGAA
jgi:uncharacterized protein YdaU (DUF1376 family)